VGAHGGRLTDRERLANTQIRKIRKDSTRLYDDYYGLKNELETLRGVIDPKYEPYCLAYEYDRVEIEDV
jgi:hypothetical protein